MHPEPYMSDSDKKLTLAAVNAVVKARGVNAILYRADEGYYYFEGPDVQWAYAASVPVYRLNHLTMEQWMSSLDEIIRDNNARRPEGEPEVVATPAPTPWLHRVVTLRPTSGAYQTPRTARVVAETDKRVQVQMEDSGRKMTFSKADGVPVTKVEREEFPRYVMELPGAEATAKAQPAAPTLPTPPTSAGPDLDM
jgi:hypothetical protein